MRNFGRRFFDITKRPSFRRTRVRWFLFEGDGEKLLLFVAELLLDEEIS